MTKCANAQGPQISRSPESQRFTVGQLVFGSVITCQFVLEFAQYQLDPTLLYNLVALLYCQKVNYYSFRLCLRDM